MPVVTSTATAAAYAAAMMAVALPGSSAAALVQVTCGACVVTDLSACSRPRKRGVSA
jgi:hypothetical protein